MSEIRVGAPVRGRLARELAHLLHWCRGHGMQIIPAHSPRAQVVSGSPVTLRYRVEPQGHAITRIWSVVISQPEPFSGGTTPVRVQITTPDAATWVNHPGTVWSGDTRQGLVIREDLDPKSQAEQTLTLAVEVKAGTATATIESVGCWELPRAVLTQDGSYDRGVDIETCQAGQPIYDGDASSLGAITTHLRYTWPRRSLIQWAGASIDVDSASWTDLTWAAEPCLPHRALRADTHLTCSWTVWYSTESGTAGEVRVTSGIDATEATATLADTAGVMTLLATQTISLRCEDPNAIDGLPAGGWETVQFAVRRTSGSGVISIASRCVWEPVTVESFLLAEDGSYLLLEDGSRIVLES